MASSYRRRLASAGALTAFVLLLRATILATQPAQPRMLQPEDYGRFEQLQAQRTPLSPDGKWLVYGITRSNRQNELRIQVTSGGAATVIAFGEQPTFSEDARWLAYLVGFSEEQEAKLRKEKKPLHKSLGLLELATGKTTTVAGIESFSFSPRGTHLAMRRYAPEARDGGSNSAPSSSETPTPGTTVIVRDLASGRDLTFGSVSELAWQHDSTRLAMAITADGGVGNGVQLLDTADGTVRVLDSSSSTYSGLTWRKDSAALAAFKSVSNDTREGATQALVVWGDLAHTPDTMRVLDPSSDGQLASNERVVRFRTPRWSEDGSFLFVGVAPWPAKATPLTRDGQSRRLLATSEDPEELPDVQVWHPRDAIVMPRQKVDARRERERSILAAFALNDGRLVRIATKVGEDATPVPRSSRALVVDTTPFVMERSIGRVYANVFALDLQSGAKTPIGDRLEDRYVQASPAGRYVLFFKNDHYWATDLSTGRATNITAPIKTSFADRESDATVDQKPPFGVAGWSRDDHTVLLYDQFDVWEVRPDGSSATRLTNGAADHIRHRIVRLDPDAEWIDRDKPLVVSQFGLRSKKSGYARITMAGGPIVTSLIWQATRIDRLTKAKHANRFAYVVQDFDDSPDYFAADETLANPTQVSSTNPFMRDYAWGRSAVVDYRSQSGQPLQGALFYPANYQPGKRYPMVVYMYEKLSDGVHQFSAPSERDYYNAAAFTTRGYVYLQPDIVFKPREPGQSVVDCVVPAVQQVIAMGLADPTKVGVLGHSWGGFDSVYLATHTDVFAAAVAGAPITDLVSNYGNHHWSSGIAETDHIETGQQRMQVPLYEDLQAYIRNSAVYRAHLMKTPLLIEVGDNDGTVHWHQGVELYNIARRAGKNVVLLQYGGEDHGLRKKANQIDYHHRIFEWFNHYLTGAPAASWIKDGERYIDRERDLQQRKLPVKPTTTTQTPQR